MIGRIHERRRFEELQRAGRRAGTDHLWCRYLPDPTAAPPRAAFAIGRAIGSAVVRNRVRRRLRALLSDAARTGLLPPGWLLIGVRSADDELTFDELRTELRRLLAAVPT